MGTTAKAAFRGGDPDPIYMNLTFPNALSRPSGSPIILEPNASRGGRHIQSSPDYANVVLNYAEIDLSHSNSNRKGGGVTGSSNSGSSNSERPLAASNNAMTEYSVIDMVATVAASQAAKDHVQSREDSVALKQRNKRHSDVSKRHSDSKRDHSNSDSASKENSKGRKERSKGGLSTGGGGGARGFLARSHSAVSRSSTSSSRDRKSSLSGTTPS